MTRRQLLILAAGLLAVFISIVLPAAVLNATLWFDEAVLTAVHSTASPQFDTAMVGLTAAGGIVAVTTAAVLLIAGLMLAHRRRYAAFAAVAIGGSAAGTALVKLLVERVRPELWTRLVVEDSFSFPSGHATASMALGLTLVLLTWQTRWRIPVIIISSMYVATIATTRLYLGVHYPTDIIGGWLMAGIWATIAVIVTRTRSTVVTK